MVKIGEFDALEIDKRTSRSDDIEVVSGHIASPNRARRTVALGGKIARSSYGAQGLSALTVRQASACRAANGRALSPFVSAADFAADQIVSAAIRNGFPGHRILCEEGTNADDPDFEGPLWIVDLIDVTANYVGGHGYFAISIAFAVDGVVLAECVHAPMLEETFLATKGADQG